MNRGCFLTILILSLQADPLLVISLMVKNEEHVMRATLEPFLQAGLKDFLIYDTGSTDKTVEVTRALFQEYNIANVHAFIIEEPFVDFSTSRNRALDLVDEKFPHAEFTLMLDAEWYTQGIPQLINFCEEHVYDNEPAYFVHNTCSQEGSHPLSYFVDRLIRISSGARFIGAIHEDLNMPAKTIVPLPTRFEWWQGKKGFEKSNTRWKRDKEILLNEVKKDALNSRAVYYLAQTYRVLNDVYNAYFYYARRVNLNGGNPEEIFQSHYNLGLIAEFLSKKDPEFTWARALGHYMDAFSFCHVRAEPLVKIAFHYYYANNMPACYLFAHHAAALNNVHNNVEKYVYDVARYDILACSAAVLGELEVGEWAARMALEAQPDNEHLKNNLAAFHELKATKAALPVCAPTRDISHINAQSSWAEKLAYCLDTHGQHASSIEPLIAIALHYYHQKNMPACYLFAHRAAELQPLDHSFENCASSLEVKRF